MNSNSKKGFFQERKTLNPQTHSRKNIPTTLSLRGTMQNSGTQNKCAKLIQDKAGQQKAIETVYQFMEEEPSFDGSISIKILQSPSGKQFQQILVFLLKCYEPQFSYDNLSSEQIPQIMKFLGYPHNLQKNMFIAIAPHTYNSVLSMLLWLVNMIRYRRASLEEEQLLEDSNIQETGISDTEMINSFLMRSFKPGISDLEINNLRNEMENHLAERGPSILNEINEIQQKIETLKMAKQNLITNQPELEVLRKEIQQKKEENFREQQVISQKINEQQNLLRKEGQEVETVKNLEKSVNTLKEQKINISKIVESQEIDVEQAQRIQNEIESNLQIKEKLIQHNQEKLKLKQQYMDDQKSIFNETDKLISEYNSILTQSSSELFAKTQQIVAKINYDIFKEPIIDEEMIIAIEGGQYKEIAGKFLNFSMENDGQKTLEQETGKLAEENGNLKSKFQDLNAQIQAFDDNLRQEQINKNRLVKELEQSKKLYETKQANYLENQETYNQRIQTIKSEIGDLKIENEQKTNECHRINNELTIEMDGLEQMNGFQEKLQNEQRVQREDILQRAILNKQNCILRLKSVFDNYQDLNQLVFDKYLNPKFQYMMQNNENNEQQQQQQKINNDQGVQE